jgi:acyl carrier protein
MEEKFIKLFKETLEMNDVEIRPDTKFRDLENWDSISFLSVLAMLDEEYGVNIEGNDFKKLVTIEDLINEIRKKNQGPLF